MMLLLCLLLLTAANQGIVALTTTDTSATDSAVVESDASTYSTPAADSSSIASPQSPTVDGTDFSTNTTTTTTAITTASTTAATTTYPSNPSAPPITSVTLSEPTVIRRLWIEFQCVVDTTVSDPQARFLVQFQCNQQSVLNVTLSTTNLTATLHERYLEGKLGTTLQCVVRSYWNNDSTNFGPPSYSHLFQLTINPSVGSLSVAENEQVPQLLHLQSTLPVTCHDEESAAGTAPCHVAIEIQTANDIAVFQAGVQTPQPCKYLLTEGLTRNGTWYFNTSQSLAVIAKSDPYATSTRYSQLVFKFPSLPTKMAGGFSYISFWSQHNVPNSPTVYRYDAGEAVMTCTATADVHYTTFDGLYYSSYGSGPFIYSRSTAGQPFEVQARQASCSGPNTQSDITCVCGVAMREDSAILILDACQDGILRAIGYNHKDLPKDSGIFADGSGYSFKIQMPSGNKVYIEFWGYIMNIRVVVIGRPPIQGMCGSPDGNRKNDLLVQGTDTIKDPVNGQSPADVVDSWRPEEGKSLFDGYLYPLPTGGISSGGVEVPPVSTYPLCSDAQSSNLNYPGDPSHPVNVLSPTKVNASGPGGPRQRNIETGVDADDQYDPSLFKYKLNTTLVNATWPTSEGITEKDAIDTCTSMIVSTANLGPSCMEMLKNATEDAQGVVNKCVLDVQLTSNYSWAHDKVAELQKSCYFIAITKDNSAINDTDEAIKSVVSEVKQVTDFACVPFDCNGHGNCANGTCNCTGDYVGSDCLVSKSATPRVTALLTPADCDVRNRPCTTANLRAENAASIPTLSCRIVASLINGTNVTYHRPGQINLAPTVTCSLPTEPLYCTAAYFNFSSAQVPNNDFYKLPQGSSVSTYTLSVSNDGVNFGNSLTMRVIDTLCLTCTTTSCSQKSNTCLIHDYCFNDGDLNPYNSARSCQPSVSSTDWSSLYDITAGSTDSYTTDGACSKNLNYCTTFLLVMFGAVYQMFKH